MTVYGDSNFTSIVPESTEDLTYLLKKYEDQSTTSSTKPGYPSTTTTSSTSASEPEGGFQEYLQKHLSNIANSPIGNAPAESPSSSSTSFSGILGNVGFFLVGACFIVLAIVMVPKDKIANTISENV